MRTLLLFALLPLCLSAQPNRDFSKKANEYMRARAQVTGFSGVVLVAYKGQPILRAAYGLASQEFDIPNTAETIFRTGSVTKQFTTAAILLLEQRGKLKVSDPVSKHIPDWPKAWNEVTLHHLLSNTGGLPPLTIKAMLDVTNQSGTTPVLFKGINDLMKKGEELQPLDSKPGERFVYSNPGFIILSMIIEQVSGKSYSDFLSQEIFTPLGMKNTGCQDPTTIMKRQANGYKRTNEKLIKGAYNDMRFLNGAGNVYSTVDDLLLWGVALDSNQFLDSIEKEKLFTPVQNSYAYGWWIHNKSGHKVYWHGGNDIAGYVGHIARYPDDQLFIAILSNVWSSADRSMVRAMATELSSIAFGENYEFPAKHNPIKLDSTALDAFVGKYGGRDTFAFVREGERLIMQIPVSNAQFEVFPESPDKFFAKWGEFFLSFSRDDKKKIKDVRILHDGEEARWSKLK